MSRCVGLALPLLDSGVSLFGLGRVFGDDGWLSG